MFNTPSINGQRQKLLTALLSAGLAGMTTAQLTEVCATFSQRIKELEEEYFIDSHPVQKGKFWRYTLIREKTYSEKLAEVERESERNESMIRDATPLKDPRELQGRLVEVRVGPNGKLVLLVKGKGAYTV